VYSPPDVDTTAGIKTVILCNQTGSSATFRIFLDDNGSTYDESTALYYDNALAANSTLTLEFADDGLIMSDSTGNLAYRVGTANAITVTVSGYEENLV
jgi:hypothetical protein